MPRRYLLPLLTALTCLGCAKAEPEPPYSHAADFAYSGTLQNVTPITFRSTSPEAKSWSWNFGDGSALSTEQQPTHTFRKAGTRLVKLTVASDGGPITQTQSLTLAPVDTLTPAFTKVVGLYRFTKVVRYTYATMSGFSNTTVEACDVLATASRDTYGLTVYSAGGQLLGGGVLGSPLYPAPLSYYFSADQGGQLGYNAVFKLATDSLTCSSYSNGRGGGGRATYYGKKQ